MRVPVRVYAIYHHHHPPLGSALDREVRLRCLSLSLRLSPRLSLRWHGVEFGAQHLSEVLVQVHGLGELAHRVPLSGGKPTDWRRIAIPAIPASSRSDNAMVEGGANEPVPKHLGVCAHCHQDHCHHRNKNPAGTPTHQR